MRVSPSAEPAGRRYQTRTGSAPNTLSRPLQLAVLFRVVLTALEDGDPYRDCEHGDDEQRPDVGPCETGAVHDRGAVTTQRVRCGRHLRDRLHPARHDRYAGETPGAA